MILRNLSLLVVGFWCVALVGQKPAAPAEPPETFGVSYRLPAGWDAIDAQSTLPEVKQQQTANAKTEEEKKEIACVQIPVSARKGAPLSFLAVMALPFDCFGQIITEKDLPGFAEGASEGPRAIFDFGDPEFGQYTLGKHHMWVERAKGSPKGHPEIPYTLEIACSLLEKAAVCWMTVAGNDQALKEFERNSVTLDGDFAAELVPATAFDKKPDSQTAN
jgi:hypothetical protein